MKDGAAQDTHHLLEEKDFLEIRHNRHPKRKNNIIVAAMYDAYIGGMSLSAIGTLYGKTRQAVYDTFRSRGYPLRSKKLVGARMVGGIRYTLDGAGYLRGTADGHRVYLHKVVWEAAHGPLPVRNQLHFIDGDKQNCALENLEVVPYEMLSRTFNPSGRNQFSV